MHSMHNLYGVKIYSTRKDSHAKGAEAKPPSEQQGKGQSVLAKEEGADKRDLMN